MPMIAILTVVLLASGCRRKSVSDSPVSRDIFAMDTYMTITCYGKQAEAAADAAEREIRRLDQLLSVGDKNSEICQLNEAGSLEVSEDVITMIREALELWSRSDGALDISVFPLVTLWGFPENTLHVPSDQELTQVSECIGADQIRITDHTVTLGDGQKIDLGAIAKGYTSARLMEIFEEYQLDAGLVSLGGNVQCYRKKPDGSKWKIGITNPEKPDSADYIGVLQLEDQAAITSGAYERYLTDETTGRTYHHILDPATGYPAEKGLSSCTIVSRDGTLADGLSTATFIMGLEDSIAYWQQYGTDFDMILVDDNGTIYVTEPLTTCFSSEHDYEVISK